MGLYDTLQTNIIEAFNNSLLDATSIIKVVAQVSTYNSITMTNDIVETTTDVRAVKSKDITGEIQDEPGKIDLVEYIIMDQDLTTILAVDGKIDDGTDSYKIESINIDPAGASHTIKCRRWS